MDMQFSEQYVLQDLRAQVLATSQKQVAKECKVTPQYLCDILKRRRPISESVAKALGYKRLVIFEKKAK